MGPPHRLGWEFQSIRCEDLQIPNSTQTMFTNLAMSSFFKSKQEAYPNIRYSAGKSYFPSRDSSGDSSSSSNESHDELLEKEIHDLGKRDTFWRRHRKLLTIHASIFAFYLSTILLVARNSAALGNCLDPLPFSPAREAIEYQELKFVLGDRIQEKGIYSGKPRPELDLAWHNLLNDENIRLEPEVMKHYGREDIGVQIPDNDGFIGTLNVYHELHCIKRLHQYMYPETYWPGIKAKQKEMNRLHNEHCLDFLRQSAMCHGDIGILTYEWSAHERIPIANATTHQCVNWSKLDKWTKDRSVDMLKPGWLVHPTLGLAYPDGQGDTIGVAENPHSGH